jgi:hypothetical protein
VVGSKATILLILQIIVQGLFMVVLNNELIIDDTAPLKKFMLNKLVDLLRGINNKYFLLESHISQDSFYHQDRLHVDVKNLI